MRIHPSKLYAYDAKYRAVCLLVDDRAKGRCEKCATPGGLRVVRHYGWPERGDTRPGRRVMYWKLRDFPGSAWIDHRAEEIRGGPPDLYERNGKLAERHYLDEPVVLSHAHLNHIESDHRLDNISLLCGWCRKTHDGMPRAVNAAETRKASKDAERPLLVAAMETGR